MNKLQIGDSAPNATVIDIDDQKIELSALWANGPTLLTFLRHFG